MQTDVRMPPANLIRVNLVLVWCFYRIDVSNWNISYINMKCINTHILNGVLDNATTFSWKEVMPFGWSLTSYLVVVCECNEVCAWNRKNALLSILVIRLPLAVYFKKNHDLPFHSFLLLSFLFSLHFIICLRFAMSLLVLCHISRFFSTCCEI